MKRLTNVGNGRYGQGRQGLSHRLYEPYAPASFAILTDYRISKDSTLGPAARTN